MKHGVLFFHSIFLPYSFYSLLRPFFPLFAQISNSFASKPVSHFHGPWKQAIFVCHSAATPHTQPALPSTPFVTWRTENVFSRAIFILFVGAWRKNMHYREYCLAFIENSVGIFVDLIRCGFCA